ncbi:MAG: VWA domain-containing protein [Pseudomonadota bacterium]
MSALLENFHFIRPLWLLAALPLLVLWWIMRPTEADNSRQNVGIAPHLATALEVARGSKRRFYAIDGVTLIGVLLTIATAGPTWTKVPNPLVAETVPLVVALKVTPSMDAPDLAPTRLELAKFKILDLIDARAGARTALIAYAGTAHRVAPLTEDPDILRPLADGLSPQVMPVEGADAAAAFALAVEVLETAETPGAVLFALDDLDPADLDALNAPGDTPRAPIVFLVTTPENAPLPQLSQVTGASTIQVTADQADIRQIERILRSVHQATLANDERLQWDDRGWWLGWPVAILVALWFRQGWTMRWSALVLSCLIASTPGGARADGWIDWFLTPDQQGWLAYQDKRFTDAGALFLDLFWRGYALYRAGQYTEASAEFQRLETADAAFAQGMAQLKNRQYRPAIRAFEVALERNPDFPAAAHNLEVAKAIVEFVESTRAQSDTGEDAGIGADDVVFDNEAARGTETEIEESQEEGSPLTTDQWIQAIDTDMGDFLRSRFQLENAQRGQ